MKLVDINDMQMFVELVLDDIVNEFEEHIRTYLLEDRVTQLIEKQTTFAILSHRWSNDELTIQDVTKIQTFSEHGIRAFMKGPLPRAVSSAGVIKKVAELGGGRTRCVGVRLFELLKELCAHIPQTSCVGLQKLVEFCDLAATGPNGCALAWMDTCCIDKTSSAELEESIRSMFRWYRESRICIVHLANSHFQADLEHDSWFTRGWTLQELLAPKSIKFYDADWQPLIPEQDNDKVPDQESGKPLWKTISRITGISETELFNFEPGVHDIRQRLGWASKRKTKRVEDLAYCLLGIFDISLPVTYGEGKTAFYRLQMEIMQRCDDIGLFVWTGEASAYNSMLAAGPGCFSDDTTGMVVTRIPPSRLLDSTFARSNHGLHIPLALHDVSRDSMRQLVAKGLVEKELVEEWLVKTTPTNPDDSERFKFGILGHSSETPVVILLRGRKYGSDTLYERVSRSIFTQPALPQVKPEIVIIE